MEGTYAKVRVAYKAISYHLVVEVKGKYLKMDIYKIADFDHEGEEWQVVEQADDPKFVELLKPILFYNE